MTTGGNKAKKVKCSGDDPKQVERPDSWSNLPTDIISLIINRLYYVDQTRFRAVCKNWRAGGNSCVVKYADKLPWIMAYNSSSCFLYNPYEKRQYRIDTSRFREIVMAETSVLDSKYGWVLFATWNTLSVFFVTSHIFFFNPFSNKIIRLPELYMTDFPATIVGTFSVSPDSSDSDCLIFVYRRSSDTPCISLCKLGDTEWTDCFLDNSFGVIIQDVEYVDHGVFYCSFETHISAFNATTKMWHLLPYPESGIDNFIYNYLTYNDGGLLVSRFTYDCSQWQVLECDVSQWDWFLVDSFGNNSLFLGNVSMYLPLEEEASELVNKIHLQNENGPCLQIRLSFILWFEFSQYVSLAASMQYHPYNNIEANQSQQLLQVYDWNVPAELKTIWIQPPQSSS